MANVARNTTFSCTHQDCAGRRTVFTTLGARQRHVREIHGPRKRCDRCEFTTCRRYHMSKHMADAHRGAEDTASVASFDFQLPPPEYSHEHGRSTTVAASYATGILTASPSDYQETSLYLHHPQGPTATLQPSHDPTAGQVNPNQPTFVQYDPFHQENYAHDSYFITATSGSSPVSDQGIHYDPAMEYRYPAETE